MGWLNGQVTPVTGIGRAVVARYIEQGARVSIGTTVFGGMVLASLVGVLFVPAMFAFFEIATELASRLFHRSRQAPNLAK